MRVPIRRIPPPLAAACLACALLAPGASAQVEVPGEARVQVLLRQLAPVEAVYLADLLPQRAPARPDLFGVTLLAAAPATVTLEVEVAREEPSPLAIFRGATDPFPLAAGTRQLTLRDLTAPDGDAAIADYEVNDAVLDDDALRAGRLPAGTYLFAVQARGEGGGVLDRDELRITVGRTTRLELLAPGAPTDVGAPPLVPGRTPRFLWSAGDAVSAAAFRIRVVRMDGEASAAEAIQAAFPVWEQATDATAAFYPASAAALPLEPGGVYAWQVTREVATSGGVEIVESPVFWFRVEGAGGGDGAADTRFALLLRALGLSPELDGFTPVGARTEDGREIPLPELEALLAAVAAGEVPLLSLRVR